MPQAALFMAMTTPFSSVMRTAVHVVGFRAGITSCGDALVQYPLMKAVKKKASAWMRYWYQWRRGSLACGAWISAW